MSHLKIIPDSNSVLCYFCGHRTPLVVVVVLTHVQNILWTDMWSTHQQRNPVVVVLTSVNKMLSRENLFWC